MTISLNKKSQQGCRPAGSLCFLAIWFPSLPIDIIPCCQLYIQAYWYISWIHGGGWGAWPPRLAASAPAPAIGSLQLLGARGRHQSTGQHSHHPVGLRAHQGAPAREGGQLTYCTLLSGGMRGALYRYGFNTHTCRYRVKTK